MVDKDPVGEADIDVSGIHIGWDVARGICGFEALPVALMWIDTTLAGLMSGVQSMVGTKRFYLALQSEGRKSVDADWEVIAQHPDFRDGFKAIANIAAVAGWGRWELVSVDHDLETCCFRVANSWEGRYQKALGVSWGSGMLAGKMAGYCARLFGTNCWAEQTRFIANGDAFDEFVVRPSERSIEREIEELLVADEATRADMAVALERLRNEILERQQAEAALREAEEKHRTVVEASHDAIFIETIDGVVKDCNSRASEMYGWSKEAFVGMHFTALVDEATAAQLPALMEKRERAGTISMEAMGRRKDGSLFPAEVNARVTEFGGESRVVVFVRDRTERKLAEAERATLEAQLRESQKMEAIGRLAGGVAHDFNNILTAIGGYAELITTRLGAGDPVSADAIEIQKATRRAAALTQQLLAFSRRQVTEPKVIQLNDVIAHSQRLLSRIIGEDVELGFERERGLWNIRADPSQIDQILVNLVVNAREAMPDGGRLTIRTANAILIDEPAMLTDRPLTGDFVVVSISDTGWGMDAETLQRIFEPFFTTKPKEQATGLGLAIVYGNVRQNGGFINVHSEVGVGTTFNLYFARVEADAEGLEGGDPQNGPLGTETVLLVEDEDMVRVLARRTLETHGYTVLEARSGGDAYLLCEAYAGTIDLLLTDVVMPHMNGRELLHRVHTSRPGLRALFMSGYSEDVVSRHGVLEEGLNFLQKPYSMNQLLRKVREVLDAR